MSRSPKSKTASKKRAPRKKTVTSTEPATQTETRGPFFHVHGLDEDFLVPADFKESDFGNGPVRFMVTDWRPGDEELFTLEEAGVTSDFGQAQKLRLEYLVALRHQLQLEIERVLAMHCADDVTELPNPFHRA